MTHLQATHSHKIVFIGAPGAGKTTCVSTISEIAPIATEVPCVDELEERKKTTTVAFDYGELSCDDGSQRLLLYGLPGQARFSFMFDVVREDLLGAVVLVDAGAADGVDGFEETLSTYAPRLRDMPVVVALNKTEAASPSLYGTCEAVMQRFGIVAPVVEVDVRRRADVVRIFEVLFTLMEYDDFSLRTTGAE